MVIRVLFYLSVLFATLTQMFAGDTFYFIGVYTFATMAFVYLSTFVKGGIEKDFLLFMAGVSAFNIYNIISGNHLVDNLLEYLYFCCGVVFFIFKYADTKSNNKHRGSNPR